MKIKNIFRGGFFVGLVGFLVLPELFLVDQAQAAHITLAPAGVESTNSSNSAINLRSTGIITDPFARFIQNTSNFSGDGLLMNFANGSGFFGGNFLNLKVNNATRFSVSNQGSVASVGTASFSGSGGSSFLGSLGVGAANPQGKLSVLGDVDKSVLVLQVGTNDTSIPQVVVKDVNGSELYRIHADGPDNLFMGFQSGQANTSSSGASQNTGLGNQVLSANINGSQNTAMGYNALKSSGIASYNSAFGALALSSASTGSFNSAFGVRSLWHNTTGQDNVGLGFASLEANTTGESNIGIGRAALASNTSGGYNLAIGGEALVRNAQGGSNLAIGYQAGRNLDGISSNGTGWDNVIIGNGAGYGWPGESSYSRNLLLGNSSGAKLLTGSNNTLLGMGSGFNIRDGNNNILLGYKTGDSIISGSGNILIGYDVDFEAPNESNKLNIGNLIYGNGVDGIGSNVSTGNIGIGIINPDEKLVVNGSVKVVGGKLCIEEVCVNKTQLQQLLNLLNP